MSRTVNRVTLVGNTGSEPDVRETASGTVVAHVSLATNRLFRKNGETRTRTDWHRLTFWGRAAETVDQYVTKGNRLYVEGRLEYGSFDRDGVTIPTAEIMVRELVTLSPRTAVAGVGAED